MEKAVEGYLRKRAAAKYLGISYATFDRAIKAGRIPDGIAIPGGTIKIWAKQDLEDFVRKCKDAAPLKGE
ncbi:MAG: helix-turn-helix domain-containing protein [Desulfovibrionaceae bacterium]|nr:helix-turn-helix domain-containing protein [Desulfovibrionaceae bacterium]